MECNWASGTRKDDMHLENQWLFNERTRVLVQKTRFFSSFWFDFGSLPSFMSTFQRFFPDFSVLPFPISKFYARIGDLKMGFRCDLRGMKRWLHIREYRCACLRRTTIKWNRNWTGKRKSYESAVFVGFSFIFSRPVIYNFHCEVIAWQAITIDVLSMCKPHTHRCRCKIIFAIIVVIRFNRRSLSRKRTRALAQLKANVMRQNITKSVFSLLFVPTFLQRSF